MLAMALDARLGALPTPGLFELGTDTGPPLETGARGVTTDAPDGVPGAAPVALDVPLDAPLDAPLEALVEGGVGVEPGDAEEGVKRSFMTGGRRGRALTPPKG